MPNKFDGTKVKFSGFIQQVRLYLHLHPFRYSNDFVKVGFVRTLLTGIALLWFAPLLERKSNILNNFEVFMTGLSTIFGKSDKKRVAET